VILSGYQHPAYRPLERCGWIRRSCKVIAHSSDKRSRRVEQLWLSPAVVGRSSKGRNRMQGGAFWTNLARVRATEEGLRATIERLRTNQDRVTIAGGSDRWQKSGACIQEVSAPFHSVMSGVRSGDRPHHVFLKPGSSCGQARLLILWQCFVR
jgi:hypothetical protein